MFLFFKREKELLFRQAVVLPQLRKFPLHVFCHGHALVLSLHPDIVLLLSRRVDPVAARRLFRCPQFPQDLASGFLEALRTQERLCINGDEKMAQRIRNGIALAVSACKHFQEAARL